MVLATCWNIPRFFETETCYLTKQSMDAKLLSEDIRKKRDNEEILYPQVCFTDLGGYTYRRDYILFANFVIMGLIPLPTPLHPQWHHFPKDQALLFEIF